MFFTVYGQTMAPVGMDETVLNVGISHLRAGAEFVDPKYHILPSKHLSMFISPHTADLGFFQHIVRSLHDCQEQHKFQHVSTRPRARLQSPPKKNRCDHFPVGVQGSRQWL